jgi:outer membrane protein TolC
MAHFFLNELKKHMGYKIAKLLAAAQAFTLMVVQAAYCQTDKAPLLTLEDAIAQGLSANFDIKVLKNEEAIALIQNNWGNAGRLPTINGTAGYNYSNTNLRQKLVNGTLIERNGASFQNENANVQVQWRLYSGGRVIAAKKRLEQTALIANLQIRQQANQVVYNIITAYLNILRLEKQLEATNETIKLFEERKKLAENRFNIGVAPKSDFLQATADLNLQRNLVITLENNIALSKTFLNNQLARNPDEAFEVSDNVADANLPNRKELLASIDSLNPQLLINKTQSLVLMQQAKEINAQRLPIVTINAGGNLNNNNNSAGFTLQNTTYGPNAGIGIAIPIFQGGVVKQQLRVNEVQQKNQALSLEILRNNLLTSLANAYNNYENARRQLELERQNLEVIKENNVIAMERFKKASITTVEFRQTQLDLVESQTRIINAQYQMKQAEADIMLIVGKLVE